MCGPQGQDRAPPDADAGGGGSGKTTDFPRPRAELPDGAAVVDSAPELPRPRHLRSIPQSAHTSPTPSPCLFPLPSDRGQASFPLQDQTGTQPAASPWGLTGYKDKLTAKGKALYTWGRHVSEEWAEPGARGAGTGVSQRQMCPGTRCSPTAGSSPATYSLGLSAWGRAHASLLVDFYIYTLQGPRDGRVRNYNLTSLASCQADSSSPRPRLLGVLCTFASAEAIKTLCV